MSKESKQRRRDAINQLKERGIRLSKKGLVTTVRGQEQVVVAPFKVLGAAVSTQGIVDGAMISAKGRDGKVLICHVPHESLQEPKRLGVHLAAIGLDPPIDTPSLRAIGTFIHTMSRLRRCMRFEREGIHLIEKDGSTFHVAAIAGAVLAPKSILLKGVAPDHTIYQMRGTLDQWKAGLKPILRGNPLVTFCSLLPFGAPCPAVLGLPGPSVVLSGASSTGKSSVAGLVQSSNSSPERLHRWTGTPNGIEGLAALHSDATLVLDELGTAAHGSLGATIYRLSSGEGKIRANGKGEYRKPALIRCSVFATGEITKAAFARSAGEVMHDGQEVRLLTVLVREQYGVFSTLPPDCADGGELARRLTAVVQANYGHACLAFVRALIENQQTIISRAPAKAKRYRDQIIEKVSAGTLSPVEGRVLDGFVTLALAGKLAVHFGILPVSGEDVMHAVSHVFSQWLSNWREGADSGSSRALLQVRGWFQQHALSDFLPIAEWDTPARRVRLGYVLNHKREGTLYLVHREALRDEICKGLDMEKVLDSLQTANLLATHGKGRQWLQRMPGVPKDSEKSRMKFYAIRGAVLFDQ